VRNAEVRHGSIVNQQLLPEPKHSVHNLQWLCKLHVTVMLLFSVSVSLPKWHFSLYRCKHNCFSSVQPSTTYVHVCFRPFSSQVSRLESLSVGGKISLMKTGIPSILIAISGLGLWNQWHFYFRTPRDHSSVQWPLQNVRAPHRSCWTLHKIREVKLLCVWQRLWLGLTSSTPLPYDDGQIRHQSWIR
jgi:hypothetical protein